jgi:hypothetical protein
MGRCGRGGPLAACSSYFALGQDESLSVTILHHFGQHVSCLSLSKPSRHKYTQQHHKICRF